MLWRASNVVCRDFAHLAVTFCRCMNIPARYCTGYLGDIGVPPHPAPMDFSAWFEAFVGGRAPLLGKTSRSAPCRIGVLISERDMRVNEITDRLHPSTGPQSSST
jgi:Transglutaminase-like superfamily